LRVARRWRQEQRVRARLPARGGYPTRRAGPPGRGAAQDPFLPRHRQGAGEEAAPAARRRGATAGARIRAPARPRNRWRRHRNLLAPRMIRVLVIDDSAVMRAFLGRVVGAQPDMELAGVVPDPLL